MRGGNDGRYQRCKYKWDQDSNEKRMQPGDLVACPKICADMNGIGLSGAAEYT